MIRIEEQVIGDDTFDVLVMKDEGFFTEDKKNDGYVQTEYRMSDGDSEGVGMEISTYDHKVIKNGDYSPHNLTKEELKVFIQFLIKCYKKM